MTSVQAFESHICGGAIITEHIVVTAAHCFRPLFVYSIRIGSNRLSEGQKISVSRIVRHELYFQSESYHDIALIVTKNAIKLDKTVDIICIPGSDISTDQLVGQLGTVIGFGDTYYGGFLSQTLKQIKVEIVSNKDCAQMYDIGDKHNIPIGIQECMICGSPTGGSDACQGDSGGPMTITISGVHHLIGIVSFGRKCGTVRIPGSPQKLSISRPEISVSMEWRPEEVAVGHNTSPIRRNDSSMQ
ncbi:unnamed protein product [Oppiella nova]|uniref:Peptidase S1 domain-containing protein n=1 Tax=Oppiella nova TaxID=334625 RepID=A0A7R9MI12_9ACAR|nr:unnamed protein product [Oppiella nova]CAG2177774.1 unnamed protein product [Oppiella nova]